MNDLKRMQMAFHSVGLHQYPIEAAVDKVAAAGYDAIELTAETLPWAAPHVTPGLSSEERKRLRRRIRDAGLVISAVAAHVNMVEADLEKRRSNLQYALGCIELASDVGTDVAHLLSGMAPPATPREEAWGWLVEGVACCIERGQALGLKIAFEPVATQFVCNVAGLQELIKALEPLSLYVNYDASHFQVHGDDPVAAVRTFGPRIVHVHVKDAKGTPEKYEFPPLGQGDVDLPGVVAALQELGYQGFLSVEYEADAFGYQDTEEEVLNGSLRFVRRLLTSGAPGNQ